MSENMALLILSWQVACLFHETETQKLLPGSTSATEAESDTLDLIHDELTPDVSWDDFNNAYASFGSAKDRTAACVEVLKQSTLSIGYIGIAETITLLTGKTYGIDHEIDNYAYSIVKTMREFVDKTQKETHLNWSCFATPAEAVAGRFANIDKNLYQNNKKLADVDLQRVFGKGYYTNSHMLDYSLETSLENKIKMEAPYHKITNAGHIFYYKLNGDLSKNLEAVKATIDAMYDGDLGYFTCTFDSDTCTKCHFHGIIDNECPCCGNKNEDEIIRVRRITGYLTGSPKKTIFKSWNDGKLAELRDRHNI